MKSCGIFVVTSLVAAVIAACGSAGHSPGSAASRSAGSQAAANEHAFVKDLAASIITVDPRLVAGPVMSGYILLQHETTEAEGAAGNTGPAATMSTIPGGYQLCSGGDCFRYTAFTTNTAGQITGMSVNGQPVAGRIATGASSSMQGLDVSGVVAYRLTKTPNAIEVAFRVQDVSYGPVNGNGTPVVLATFNTSSGRTSADSDSSLPMSLSPGDTVYGAAEFLLPGIPGTFELTSSDGHNLQLASISVSRP